MTNNDEQLPTSRASRLNLILTVWTWLTLSYHIIATTVVVVILTILVIPIIIVISALVIMSTIIIVSISTDFITVRYELSNDFCSYFVLS